MNIFWPEQDGLVRARRLIAIVLVVALAAEWAGLAWAAPASERSTRLSGHVLPALKDARRVVAPGADAEPLTLTVVLNRTDQAGFERYLRDVYDSHTPQGRRFLSQREITTRFGPTQEAYDGVRAYLERSGFALVQGAENRLTLTVRGTRAQAERAFTVRIADFQLGDRRFYANDQEPSLPEHIARDVQAIAGLTNAGAPATALGQATPEEIQGCDWLFNQPGGTPALYGSLILAVLVSLVGFFVPLAAFPAVVGASVGADLPAYYCLGLLWGLQYGPVPGGNQLSLISEQTAQVHAPATSGPDVRGRLSAAPAIQANMQKIGLLQFDTFRRSDVEDWLRLTGADPAIASRLSAVAINGGVSSPGAGQSEVLLDIATVMITNASPNVRYVVYHGPLHTSFQQLFNAMINDGVTVISNSWSQCEDQTSLAEAQSIDSVLAQAAASGISVFNASGDTGSTCLDGSANTVGVPASSPHATAVGGTTPQPGGPGYTYGGETWWNGSGKVPPTGQGGFGTSRHFTRPVYQNGLTSSPMRSVPDVAVVADPRSGLALCQADAGGCPTGLIYGGTSMAAPALAGMVALLNERLGANIGEANPVFYSLHGTNAFHSPVSMGTDFAHVGLGSPHFNYLRLALSGESIGPVSTSASLVTRTGNVPADGETPGLVQVNLFDANGYPVSGKTVTLTAIPSGNVQISPSSGVSDVQTGAVAFTVKNATIQEVTFTATADGLPLPKTATVSFVSPPAAAGGITAAPATVASDGTSAATITVTLQDAKGNGTPGKLVSLSQGSGHSVITGPTPSVTDSNGRIQFAVTDRVNETVTYTAFDETDNAPVPGSAVVTFTGSNTSCLGPVPSAAPGFTLTPFANGFIATNFFFGNINFIGCPGASNPAFGTNGSVLVADFPNGNLYKFGTAGGAVSNANVLSTLGPTFGNLVFGKDGRLYGTHFSPSDIVQVDPATGAVVRTVASGFPCPANLAVDPLSGDLFFNDSCTGGGSDNPSVWRIHDPGGATPTVSVYASLPATPGGGMAFSPDGTLYAIANSFTSTTQPIVRISGTDTPTPATVTTLAGLTSDDGTIAIGAVQPGGAAKSLLVHTGGSLKLVDITTNPFTTTTLATGTIGAGVIGPDGCLYANAHDTILKLTPASGECGFTPTNPSALLRLTPASISPDPAQGTTQTFTASFRNVNVPGGTPVLFRVSGVNPRLKLVRTDANGQAVFAYTGTFTGTDIVIATATVSSETLTSNIGQVTWAAGKHTTFLTLNLSPTSGIVGAPVTVTASLADVSARPPAAIAGAPVTFTLGGQSCQGVTGGDGLASCAITPAAGGLVALTAAVAGTDRYLAATASTGFGVGAELPPANTITALGDAHLWVGLKNSDDSGTQFDLKVELLKNGAPVASGLQRCITGLVRSPDRAREVGVPWSAFTPVTVGSDDRLAIRISARVGTNPDGSACRGPGGSHRSAVGLRLYYDALSRAAHFDATIGTSTSQFLHSDGLACPSQGVSRRILDGTAPTASSAKCADSGKVQFIGGNTFSVIGTWSMAP